MNINLNISPQLVTRGVEALEQIADVLERLVPIPQAHDIDTSRMKPATSDDLYQWNERAETEAYIAQVRAQGMSDEEMQFAGLGQSVATLDEGELDAESSEI